MMSPDALNGIPVDPQPVQQVVFVLFSNGQFQAQSTADPLLTMKLIGKGTEMLADSFVKNSKGKIVEAPAGIHVPRA